MARPTIYNEKLAEDICHKISQGDSLRKICKEKDMPVMSVVLLWVVDGKHKMFSEQYERACNARAEVLFEESLELSDKSVKDIVGDDKSDNARVSARKLQVDTRKWYISKVLPKKFGDKVDVTTDGKPIPLLNVLHHPGSTQIKPTKEEN